MLQALYGRDCTHSRSDNGPPLSGQLLAELRCLEFQLLPHPGARGTPQVLQYQGLRMRDRCFQDDRRCPGLDCLPHAPQPLLARRVGAKAGCDHSSLYGLRDDRPSQAFLRGAPVELFGV